MNFSIYLDKLLNHISLSEEESMEMMEAILKGGLTPAQAAGFLTALRSKGETIEEITGFVKALRNNMVRIHSSSSIIVDTCGTGGDGTGSFNISTASGFVVAGAGFAVAKHGNRSVSSRCGSADVLEALGVKIDMSKETAQRCLNEIGITFLFAPLYHPAMKNVAPIRKELGVRTVFNILGPMLNPASSNVQVIGVSNPKLITLLSHVLKRFNTSGCSIVLHDSGYDEWLISKKAKASIVSGDRVKTLNLSNRSTHSKSVSPSDIIGGDAKSNAERIKRILSGEESPAKSVVIANAALALFCAKRAQGDSKFSIEDGTALANDSILSGKAHQKLRSLVEWSCKE